jgi:hypothetical protein
MAFPTNSFDATPSPTLSESTVDAALPEASTGPPVIRNSGAPRRLTLADLFEHEDWTEGLYQIPQSATPVQAMAREITCYKESLEVRLAQATGKATVTVAQALDSRNSDVTLEFRLLSNHRPVDAKIVRFDQVAQLSAPLQGVSVLNLEVGRAQGTEPCYATALITEFLLTPQ